MIQKRVYATANLPTPNRPILHNPEVCTACNNCVEVCPVDVFIPHPDGNAPPILLHPDECWYCGCCVNDCPAGALKLNWPLQQRGYWKRKSTGEIFRI